MDKIVSIQREKFDNFYKITEDFLFNLNNGSNLSYDSQLVLIDKLRLLNNKFTLIEDDINDILYDLKRERCVLSSNARLRIQEEDDTNNILREMSPLLLYYLVNRQNN